MEKPADVDVNGAGDQLPPDAEDNEELGEDEIGGETSSTGKLIHT